jgi:hypothetical protein
MTTTALRRVAEDPAQHSKLARMKIATLDDSMYHFLSLNEEAAQILWSCDRSNGCKGLVATSFDGELTSVMQQHSRFCANRTAQRERRKRRLLGPPVSVAAGGGSVLVKKRVKMQEVLAQLGSLSSAELRSGVLECTDRPRTLLPVPDKITLPDSIPKVRFPLQNSENGEEIIYEPAMNLDKN